jgi:hypothetical protein
MDFRFTGPMQSVFILCVGVAIGLSACAPVDQGPDIDIASFEKVCVSSIRGDYCKDLQGNLLSGPELAQD